MINDYPPLIIYEENKKEYYSALQIFDENLSLEELHSKEATVTRVLNMPMISISQSGIQNEV